MCRGAISTVRWARSSVTIFRKTACGETNWQLWEVGQKRQISHTWKTRGRLLASSHILFRRETDHHREYLLEDHYIREIGRIPADHNYKSCMVDQAYLPDGLLWQRRLEAVGFNSLVPAWHYPGCANQEDHLWGNGSTMGKEVEVMKATQIQYGFSVSRTFWRY